MAVINPPAWMQAGSYPAQTDRLVVSSLLGYPGFLADEATPTRIRQGVRPSYQNQQLKVRAAPTPNMTVIVSAGYCYIDNHDTGGKGTYVCVNDADITLAVAPAGGAGQYRKDCVVASVYDAETAGSVSEWRLEVIQGTYAASAGAAVRPSLPPNAQILADLAIGPSQTSVAAANITDIRQYSTGFGGILPVASAAAPNRPHPGQLFYLTDLDRFRYGKLDGSTADMQAVTASGWKTLTTIGSYLSGATAAASPNTPEVQDVVMGGLRIRYFRGIINLSGVTTAAFNMFNFSAAYRPAAEINWGGGGAPSSAPLRAYLSGSGNLGITGQSTPVTSINLRQFFIVDAPGVVS
ncbi:hypothetical protein ABZ070_10330 [Streptomyces sp. NPDC006283]|uniref:hypothetical protein n=1 Tax=Streptomyces sp. NPDC006283 TaxID=3156741 RepID=UPI0033A5E41E